MKNYNISSDNRQGKNEGWVWKIAILILTLDKTEQKDNQYGEYNNISSDTGQDKTLRQSVWKNTTIVLITDRKLNGSHCGELEQYDFWQRAR